MKRGYRRLAEHHLMQMSREMKKFGSVDLHVESGKATLELRAKRQRETFVRSMAALLAAWFLEKQGRNYVEVELSAPPLTEQIPPGWGRCIGPLILTVQRRDGQTPHQLRAKAEAERDALLAQAQEPNVIKVYPAYAGGHDPLNLVAAWNTLHPHTPLVVVDDAFEVCQAYLVTGAAYETAQATLRGLPDRPVIWLDEDHTTAVFADREGFLGGHGADFAAVFPLKQTRSTVSDNPEGKVTHAGDAIIPADVRHVLDGLAWNPADKKSDLLAYIRDAQDALNTLLTRESKPAPTPDPDEANREQIIAAARAQYEHEGSVEIDDQAAFSRGADDGLYVAAWVWVPWESASEDMTDEELVEVTGSFSVNDGPAEFDNLLDAVNACKVAAAASRTLSHVFEHHSGSKSEVWEVDGCASEEEGVGSPDVT
jgi:hypothetical protein